MLVLMRKVGEKLELGDTITIVVLNVRGGEVRLGITAPPEVSIRRDDAKVTVRKVPPEC